MINYYEPKLDLTLLGCGFLGSYHLGAICLLKQIWPQRPYNRICGASCGGLLGALLVAGVQLELVLENAVSIIRRARSYIGNPTQLEPIKGLVEQCLERLLPADAHKRCSGQLGVSVTKVCWPNGGNKFISEFHSRRDLIEAISAGCFIPLWSGSLWGPKFRGETHIDGAYSNNKPKFELGLRSDADTGQEAYVFQTTSQYQHSNRFAIKQIELSPFAGEVDVSPNDANYWNKMKVMGTIYLFNWNNLLRSVHAMFPFRLPTYLQYLTGGHSDMKDYLFRNNLIKCERCFSQQGPQGALQDITVIDKNCPDKLQELATPTTPDKNLEPAEYSFKRLSCIFCLKILEQVDSLEIPKEMQSMMLDD